MQRDHGDLVSVALVLDYSASKTVAPHLPEERNRVRVFSSPTKDRLPVGTPLAVMRSNCRATSWRLSDLSLCGGRKRRECRRHHPRGGDRNHQYP